jgi:hypothetical protein
MGFTTGTVGNQSPSIVTPHLSRRPLHCFFSTPQFNSRTKQPAFQGVKDCYIFLRSDSLLSWRTTQCIALNHPRPFYSHALIFLS